MLVVLVVAAIAARVFLFRSPASPVQSHRSFQLDVLSGASSVPGQASSFSFRIKNEKGDVVRDFAVTQGAVMRLFVIRKDLADFQRLSPSFDAADGTFTVKNLLLPSDGPYRLFVDFAPQEAQKDPSGNPLGVTLNTDITVGDSTRYKPQSIVPDEEFETVVEGIPVAFVSDPDVPVVGEAVTLVYALIDPMTGQPITQLPSSSDPLGQVVVLKEGSLDFLHASVEAVGPEGQHGAHQASAIFRIVFPSEGVYRVFGQFDVRGKSLTTINTITVGK